MRSIERTLLAWILGALSLGALVVALVTYLVTLEEMHEVFDADLKNVAQAVASYHHAGHGPGDKELIASPHRRTRGLRDRDADLDTPGPESLFVRLACGPAVHQYRRPFAANGARRGMARVFQRQR